MSSYTGEPPETPWEIEIGFFLENYGKNAAKNTRIFVSNFKAADGDSDLEMTSLEILELKRPIDLVPSNEIIAVKVGKISSDTRELVLNLQSGHDDDVTEWVGADTRGKIRFSGKFYISCDDKNSFTSIELIFKPSENEWASSLLEDYADGQHLIQSPLRKN